LKRVKRRYLAVIVDCEAAVSQRDFLDAVWTAVTRLYGEFGASQAGLSLVDFNEEKKAATIRVSLRTLQQVRASIASIMRIQGKEAAVHVIAISGTIKSLREKA
jgi:RNase P/RNase MRP subunit POP5